MSLSPPSRFCVETLAAAEPVAVALFVEVLVVEFADEDDELVVEFGLGAVFGLVGRGAVAFGVAALGVVALGVVEFGVAEFGVVVPGLGWLGLAGVGASQASRAWQG